MVPTQNIYCETRARKQFEKIRQTSNLQLSTFARVAPPSPEFGTSECVKVGGINKKIRWDGFV